MTSTVTEVTRATILLDTYGSLLTRLDVVVILLLVVILVQKELIRVLGSSRSITWMRVLDISIVPLLFAFSLIMLRHILDLMFPL